MKTSEVRSLFLQYFKSLEHSVQPSSSLVIKDDPTLLFPNAGMNQFKDCFLGNEDRGYTRATTSQKCMRISGKHNDLENVGVTARHHTFFEMLGNFSFGDYFKKEVIAFAYEFVNKLNLDHDKLWVTIFEDDDEAGQMWEAVGVPKDRILKCGEEDNFWAMGDTGPCGPCSELHYYVGNDPKNQSETEFRKDDGTYLEFWNLVFMQYNRDADGNLNPLPKPSVDTGMGLERITAILNNYPANYNTDSLRAIIATCEKLSGDTYVGEDYTELDLKTNPEYAKDVAMRVIADHTRSISFLIADGIVPSSDGSGYVLRRLIRRAIRHGKVLNFKDLFLKKTCSTLIEQMSEAYPELEERKDLILNIAHAEEEKFNETIDAGLEQLAKETKNLKAGDTLNGEVAFLLHDTYGFPVDLTEDALKAQKIQVDRAAFDKALAAQKTRSREDRKKQNISFTSHNIDEEPTKFLGYEQLEANARVLQILKDDAGQTALLFDQTPFYAESGGQVGDIGQIDIDGNVFNVTDVAKVQGKYFLHAVEGNTNNDLVGKTAKLIVDKKMRAATAAHHSATHLVHSGLRKFLGEHVKQAGSRVSSESLRFDYSHFSQVTKKELKQIQDWVNDEIAQNHQAETKVMSVDKAKETGAMALFGEKYGDKVRVVEIGPNSLELCGGTHVGATGEIGQLIIKAESGVATGTRRIECLVGSAARAQIEAERTELATVAGLLKTDALSVEDKVNKLLETQKTLERELNNLKSKVAGSSNSDLVAGAETNTNGVKIITAVVDHTDSNTMRSLVDDLRVKLGSGVVILGAVDEKENTTVVTGVTSDLKDTVHAGNILKLAMKEFGGRGGGRPDFAQGGGVKNNELTDTLEKIKSLV